MADFTITLGLCVLPWEDCKLEPLELASENPLGGVRVWRE